MPAFRNFSLVFSEPWQVKVLLPNSGVVHVLASLKLMACKTLYLEDFSQLYCNLVGDLVAVLFLLVEVFLTQAVVLPFKISISGLLGYFQRNSKLKLLSDCGRE